MYETKRLDVLRQRIDDMLFGVGDMEYKNTQQIREDLQRDIDLFLSEGGKINVIENNDCVKPYNWKANTEFEAKRRKINEQRKKSARKV